MRQAFERFGIVAIDSYKAWEQWCESSLHSLIAGGREGTHGSTVKRAFQHHDLRRRDAIIVAIPSR